MLLTRTKKILVVDDEAVIRGLLIRFLSSEGYEVKTAASSKQALPVYEQDAPFDVLFCDVCLGESRDGNGWSVVEKIRALQPSIKVLMFTGRTTVDVPPSGGTYMIIAKPFTPKSLKAALASLW